MVAVAVESLRKEEEEEKEEEMVNHGLAERFAARQLHDERKCESSTSLDLFHGTFCPLIPTLISAGLRSPAEYQQTLPVPPRGISPASPHSVSATTTASTAPNSLFHTISRTRLRSLCGP